MNFTKDIHILVVDDSKENLSVVSKILKDKGLNLALALDGKNALKILESDDIDLILLDIMMPDMDGFEVCKAIKKNPSLKDIPVIFLTAKTETEDIIKGFKLGGVDYITKPFNKEELYVRIKTHLELKFMREYFKEQAKESKESRNSMMKMLLDFGKMIDPNN